MSNFDLIDFTSIKKEDKENDKVNYDKQTTETYRILRMFKICPISNRELREDNSFKFKDKWDPFTGIRKGLDEIGALYFDPNELYKYYYKNRLNNLWHVPENNFEGYYGDLVGIGKEMNIKSRGNNSSKYLFRLPIVDCYLMENHNHSIVTVGPILTDEEINEIDNLLIKNKKRLTPLLTIKKYYDNAVLNELDINSIEYKNLKRDFPNISEIDLKDRYHRIWVEKLKYLY
jgi:hypothetical protein